MSIMDINYTMETTDRTNEDQLVQTSDILNYCNLYPICIQNCNQKLVYQVCHIDKLFVYQFTFVCNIVNLIEE